MAVMQPPACCKITCMAVFLLLSRLRSASCFKLLAVVQTMLAAQIPNRPCNAGSSTTNLSQLCGRLLARLTRLSLRRRLGQAAPAPTALQPTYQYTIRCHQDYACNILVCWYTHGWRHTSQSLVVMALLLNVCHKVSSCKLLHANTFAVYNNG